MLSARISPSSKSMMRLVSCEADTVSLVACEGSAWYELVKDTADGFSINAAAAVRDFYGC